MRLCSEATVTQRLVWKRGIAKRGILKSFVSHVLNFMNWIKPIYDQIMLGISVLRHLAVLGVKWPFTRGRGRGYKCCQALGLF